jgi:MoaA/NifB/PqqE/SkfB family radical SAM enzyme
VQKGITLLKDRGVSVKTQVVLSTHNLDRIDDLVETVRRLNAPMMVQPVWSRLLGSTRKNPGLPSNQLMQTGVLRLIELKKQNAPIVNSMAALRHFLSWPDDRDIGCIAGISMFKMLPDGRLTGCVRTPEKPHWVDLKTMDVSSAIRSQPKVGCRQCWCAGQVEAQMAGRFNPEAIFGLLGRYF